MQHRILWVFMLLISIPSMAQESAFPLKVGDTVPSNAMNYIKRSLTMESAGSFDSAKLVILDFWTITCSGCVAKFPAMETLQSQFKKNLKIITVNPAPQKTIDSFISRLKRISSIWRMPHLDSIVDDTLLNRLFPHFALPHEVWIRHDGKIAGITQAEYVTSENIQDLLEDKPVKMPEKNDLISFRQGESLLSQLPPTELSSYSCIYNYIPGIDEYSLNYIVDSGRQTVRLSRSNSTIIQLFTNAITHIRGQMDLQNDPVLGFGKQIILEVRDSANYFFSKSLLKYREDWMNAHSFCYEEVIPLDRFDHLYDFMLSDLTRYFHIKGSVVKKKMNCYALVRIDSMDRIKSTGNKILDYDSFDSSMTQLYHFNITHLIRLMNVANKHMPFLFVDETNYKLPVDMEIKSRLDDIVSLRKELKEKYGLDLIWKPEVVKMVKLTEDGFVPPGHSIGRNRKNN
jgi:thiol-disulfide isomerase/thioredoxin